jgi:NAD(P)-dependent dehydrogenase (short-subunit alcohol dehydrogenase family)
MSDNNDLVWFITGCSTGFGHELAKLVLERGGKAVITARNAGTLKALTDAYPQTALALPLDVTKQDQIDAAIAAATAKFGGIGVLVNNAGYGYQAAIEDGDDAAIRAQFDANVFGLFAVTRAVLPVMRAARAGYIMNITSVAGYIGFPGSGYYAASKHAVEGFTDALAAEVGPLGIHVIGVAPGPFRTDWAGRSLTQTIGSIPDSADTAYARMQATAAKTGTQPGDPVRAAAAMIALTTLPHPPRSLVLGAMGMATVTKKLQAELAEIESWRARSEATDYPAG